MPHLNPAPWLWTLIVTWAMLLMLLMPKILLLHHTSHPTPTTNSLHACPWTWPWP